MAKMEKMDQLQKMAQTEKMAKTEKTEKIALLLRCAPYRCDLHLQAQGWR